MPRLEIGSGQQRAFREITVSGSAVITRACDADADGEAGPPVQFDSPDEARAEAARLIAQARADGYEPIYGESDGDGDGGDGGARNPDLIEAIIDASVDTPDDDAGYLVYGDWLQSVGDPRGELVMLQHKLDRKPHDRKLRRAEQEFQKRHGDRMLPPRLREQSAGRDAPCTVDWRCGFIHRVYLSRTSWHPAYTVRELLAALLEHPSAQLLQELIIGPLVPEPPHDYQPVIDTPGAMAPSALRVLELGEDDTGAALGDVTGLLSRLPRLDQLHLRGDAFRVGALHAPALRSLSLPALPAGDAGGQSMYAIMRARWPRLETLALRGELGLTAHGGGSADIAQPRRGVAGDDSRPFPVDVLGPLLAGDTAAGSAGDDGGHFPALRHLAITHTPNTADIWRAIVAAPVLGQLDTLDLSDGSLGDADVPMMLRHPERLADLRELHLQRNCISRDHRADVRQLCITVLLDDQRGAGADTPQLTLTDIHAFAPDYRSIPAAREYLDRDRWEAFALWETVFWGRCRGTELYDVFVDVTHVQAEPSEWEAACTCPSAKIPCKHALALMYVAERYRAMPVQQPPDGFIARCRASRYDDWTE